MNLKIDKSGRLVLPKSLRDRFGLRPDTAIEVIEQPEGMLLRAIDEAPRMVKVGGLWVHQGRPDAAARFDDVVDKVRDERVASVLGVKRAAA